MDLPSWWQIPAMAVTFGILIGFVIRLGRKDKTLDDHTSSIKEHSKLLRECADKDLVSRDLCKIAQADCVKGQEASNKAITDSIAKLADDLKHSQRLVKKELQESQAEIKKDAKDATETTRKELMRINKSMGRIEGIISRLRFDNGDIKP